MLEVSAHHLRTLCTAHEAHVAFMHEPKLQQRLAYESQINSATL